MKPGQMLLSVYLAAAMRVAADAQEPQVSKGPLMTEFGRVASVDGAEKLPVDTEFKVAFDVMIAGETGKVNRRLESAARFLNMHAAAGVPVENLDIAIVVHGPAVQDLTSDARYGSDNANAELIAALQAHGVSFQMCGQSAAFRGVKAADLLPGVKMSLSAMTAHALLQQQGYTLNPF